MFGMVIMSDAGGLKDHLWLYFYLILPEKTTPIQKKLHKIHKMSKTRCIIKTIKIKRYYSLVKLH